MLTDEAGVLDLTGSEEAMRSEREAPAWATADDADVAYFLRIYTENETNNRPSVQLIGTKAVSAKQLVSRYADSRANQGNKAALHKNEATGIWLAGITVGNVGLPYGLRFEASSGDGWTFSGIEVLVCCKRPAGNWDEMKKILPHGAPAAVIDEALLDQLEAVLAARPERLSFRQRRCLSTDERDVDGSDIYVRSATITADGWGMWEDQSWERDRVLVDTERAVTDNRWATEPIPRELHVSHSVSHEALSRALSIQERRTTKRIGVTVGVEKTSEVSGQVPVGPATVGAKSGWKVSGTFKFSKEKTNLSRNESETRESSGSTEETYHKLSYKVPAGCVTVFSVEHWARVETLPQGFHGADIVRADDGLIETRIIRRDYRVDEQGDLREYGAAYAADGSATSRWGDTFTDFDERKPRLSTRR